MKIIFKLLPTAFVLSFACASASASEISGNTAPIAATGSTSFITQDRTYLGAYSTAERFISVNIDGLTYSGNYAANVDDQATPSSGAVTATWGRAFLFASSAKTLQCKLDTGFPKVSGNCLDADGRSYVMKAVALAQ